MKNFKSKNARSQRILIAEDVLRQLVAGKIQANHNDYFTWEGQDVVLEFDEGLSLKEALKPLETCDVCAKGAAFLAIIDRFDTVKVHSDFWGYHGITTEESHLPSDEIHKTLFEYFDRVQLMEIEAAFEGWGRDELISRLEMDDISVEGLDKDDIKHGFDFGIFPADGSTGADIRLAMIMRNIIEHDGDFNAEAFISEMKTTGYDEKVLEPWIEDAKRENKND